VCACARAIFINNKLCDVVFFTVNLFWKDPLLAWQLLFGPFATYQYRLMGPHQWDGAREATMTIWDRIAFGLSPKSKPKTSLPTFAYLFGVIILAVIIRWLIFALF